MKVENIYFDNFETFLKDVILPGGMYQEKMNGFVFRGERTNKYKLLPGALRENQIENLFGNSKPIDNQCYWLRWQIHAEYSLLREFYKKANYNGLKVPKIDSILKNYKDVFPTELMLRNGYYKWLSDDIIELAALAQHYGVLTRLIDWTYEIYVALYFASIGAIKNRQKEVFDSGDNIIIWALNAYYIQFLQPTTERIPLNFVVPAYYDNPNLNAQKGVLTYWEQYVPSGVEETKLMFEKNMVMLTDRTPLDELLKKYCADHQDRDTAVTLLYKFEFPVAECINVYEFLSKMNYTAARLFPGYSGIVKDMEEVKLFNQVKELEK